MLAVLAIVFLVWLVFGYFAYGRWIANQFKLDDARETPANTVNDGEDFVPTPAFYLFGQHFSAIAAAGPIAGPIIACQAFGWLPCLCGSRSSRSDRRGSRFCRARLISSSRSDFDRGDHARKARQRRRSRNDGVHLDRARLCHHRFYGHHCRNVCRG